MNNISQKKRFPFAFKSNETLVQNLLISLVGQTEKVLYHTSHYNANPEVAIHEIRKSFKRLRAVAVILKQSVPDEYKKWNAFWKDCSRKIATARESCVTVNTLAHLTGEITEIKSVCDTAVARRNNILVEIEKNGTITELANSVSQSMNLNYTLVPHSLLFIDISASLTKAFANLRKQHKKTRVNLRPEEMHELRKRCKIIQYHTELMSELNPELLVLNSQISSETELLGRYNDLNDLKKFGLECRDSLSGIELELLLKLIKKQKKSLRKESLNRISHLMKMDTHGYLDKFSVLNELHHS